MDSLTPTPPAPPNPPAPPAQQKKPPFELKKLTPRHKQAASLLAQGLGREEIGSMLGWTPEYITMLARQPLFIEYVKEMTRFTDLRLQALFDTATDTLATSMRTGSTSEKLRAAEITLRANNKAGNVQVSGQVKHQHSLLAVLTSLPPAQVPFQNGTILPPAAIEVKD